MKSYVSTSLVKGAVLGALFSGSILAHEGATGIVRERMDAMSEMSDATKAVAAMLKGEVEFDAAAIAEHASALVEHGEKIVDQFPVTEHSRTGSKTEALAKVWDSPGEFEEIATDLTRDARDLKDAAVLSRGDQSADIKAIKIVFSRVAKTCKACHKDFRKPKG